MSLEETTKTQYEKWLAQVERQKALEAGVKRGIIAALKKRAEQRK